MNEQDYGHISGNECEIVAELLSAFYDEELNDTSDAFVRRHLESCPSCAAEFDELKATVLALNSLPKEGTPEHDLWPGIMAGAAASDLAAPLGEPRRQWWTRTPILIAAGLAALLIPAGAFVTGMALTRARHAPEPPAAPGAGLQFDLQGLDETIANAMRVAQEAAQAAAEGALRGAGESGLGFDALIDALHDEESAEVRVMAARGLGESEDPRAIEALSDALLSDPDDEVRRWAAWALGEIEDPRGVPPLTEALLKDSYGEARRWAAWALGEIEDPRGVPPLMQALQNDNVGEARRWAAWALGEIDDPRAVPALSNSLLNDSVTEVRRWAAWALGEIGDPRAEQALTAATKDRSPEVRRWAIWALTEISH